LEKSTAESSLTSVIETGTSASAVTAPSAGEGEPAKGPRESTPNDQA
jgi:hypothetical protein